MEENNQNGLTAWGRRVVELSKLTRKQLVMELWKGEHTMEPPRSVGGRTRAQLIAQISWMERDKYDQDGN